MIRRVIYAAILVLTGIYVFNHLEELKLIVSTFRQGEYLWMIAAVGAHILWLVAIAASLQSTYRLSGIRENLRHLIPLTTAGNFINVVAPSYGVGAMAVFMADGSKRGKAAGKVSTGSILYLVYDYIGFMLILPGGLIILSMRGALTPIITASALIAAGIAMFVFTATYLGLKNTNQLKSVLQSLTGSINRALYFLLKRELIPAVKVDLFIKDVVSGLQGMRGSVGTLILPAVFALSRKASAMLILYFSAMAFQVRLDGGALFASFTIAYLFNIVSITPSGIGFVEGALTLILNALGIPLAEAAAITMTYRGITFWLTLIYGIGAIRIIGYPLTPYRPAKADPLPAQPPQPNEASFKRDTKLSP